jgi:acyl-CoA synthetase (AMP-forming)/AMP-acid ligase II
MSTFLGPPIETEQDIGPSTLGAFISDAATKHADREAVAFHESPAVVRWSYRDLERESRRVGRALLAAGLAPGERVAALMGNRPEWIASVFGIALAGGVVVPVNTFLEPPEIAYVLEHCEASMLLMQDRLRSHAYLENLLPERFPSLRHIACLGIDASRGTVEPWPAFLERGAGVSDADLDARAASVDPDDDAIIIYTSGTTAKPKGVLHAHRVPCLQSRRFARHLCLDESVRAWCAFPLFWTAGFAMMMGATFAVGGCVVLQETFEAGEALALLERERVTSPHAWPHQLGELEGHPDWARADLSALRHVESFGPFGRHPTVRVPPDAWSPRAAYGLTETFTIVTSLPSDAPPELRDRTQGRPLPGTAIRILDPSTGEPLPAGAHGEIAVAGPTMMKGYLKVPRDQVFDADGFFHTGDAGFVDTDGLLHWTGRTSDLIKTGGANVSPVEIETELLRHPGLKAAAAVGVPDSARGEIVVVLALAREGVSVDEEEVRSFLKGRIASYKIPRRVVFVREDELSLTGNAKIKPEELRALALARLAGPAART